MILSSGCIFNYNNCKGCNSCQYLLPPIKFQTENFLPHSLEVGKACSKFPSPPALYLMACATLSRLLLPSPSTEMFPSLFGRVRDTTSVSQDSCPWDAHYQINTLLYQLTFINDSLKFLHFEGEGFVCLK